MSREDAAHAEAAIYEVCMAHWHIPFDHIEERWTDREFFALLGALIDRLDREAKAINSRSSASSNKKSMSLGEFVRMSGGG